MRFSAWYGVVVGVLVPAQWAVFLATGNVPQLEEAPWEIWFHMVAEFLLAVVILVGGIGMLAGRGWARTVYLVGLGMVVYSVVNSPGYFAQRGEWPLVAMFMVLLVLSVVAAVLLARSGRDDGRERMGSGAG